MNRTSGDKERTENAPTPAAIRQAMREVRENRAGTAEVGSAFAWLADRFGTPLYVYDAAYFRDRFAEIAGAFTTTFRHVRLLYALKANSNPAIVSSLVRLGAGAEVVSGGELQIARRCGVTGPEILFTSSSKSTAEIELALREQCTVNVDSLDELEQLEAIAERLELPATISVRINPAVNPDTLEQINTGRADSKFGLPLVEGGAFEAYAQAARNSRLHVRGLHCHIGSQILQPTAFCQAAAKILALAARLRRELNLQLSFIDLGGGIGIPYRDGEAALAPSDLAAALAPIWRAGVAALGYEPELWVEPGRYVVGPAGMLLTRVNSVKSIPGKTFVNVDAGFQTLARPAMYGAYHRVRILGRTAKVAVVEIAGNVCETGDILASQRNLPLPVPGDLLAVLDVGAYGYAMASHYNSRPLPAEVLIDDGDVTLIRRCVTLEDLAGHASVNDSKGPFPLPGGSPTLPTPPKRGSG